MVKKKNLLLFHVLRNNSRLVGLEAYQRHIKLLYLQARKKDPSGGNIPKGRI